MLRKILTTSLEDALPFWMTNPGYCFCRAAYRWVRDNDGGIGLEVFGRMTLIKYKYSTIVIWGKTGYADAEKYVPGPRVEPTIDEE